jgi:hypothetical protein
VATGLELAPKSYSLTGNRQAAWQKWIETAHGQGEDAAKELIRKLRKEHEKDRGFQDVVHNYVSHEMHKLVEKAKDHPGAIAFIERHREFLPDDAQAKDMKTWVWQEWIAAVDAPRGEEASRTLIRVLRKENAKEQGFQDVVYGHVVRTMNKKLNDAKEAKDFRAVLALIERHRELLRDDGQAKDLSLVVYDAWAKPLMKPGKWAEAIKLYQDALIAYPNDSHLTQNLKYCEQESKRQGK